LGLSFSFAGGVMLDARRCLQVKIVGTMSIMTMRSASRQNPAEREPSSAFARNSQVAGARIAGSPGKRKISRTQDAFASGFLSLSLSLSSH